MSFRSKIVASTFSFISAAGVLASSPVRAADTYKIDPVHSTVIFRISHLGSSWTYGRFDQSEGTFTVDAAKPEDVKFDITVKADSVDTNSAARDKHLKSGDFFSAEQFPTLTFKSTSVKSDGEKKYIVSGDLTMHGVTKQIEVPMEFIGTSNAPHMGERAGYEAHFSVKRSDYGMDKMTQMVGDEVHLTVSLEGTK